MLRVRTIFARAAQASARYYTRYLEPSAGERPGQWAGRQASVVDVSGKVDTDQLEALLSGHHPITGERLGSKLVDRYTKHGTVIRAVAGFDATFSAPKSVSAWWGLTGDPGVQAAHDLAVQVVLDHVEAHATTRVRVNGPRMYPDVEHGLTMAVFPQATSREDDPQLHTHSVISTKVIGSNGRWYALDGHYVKNNQRALGGLYQSVLRAELSHRFGVRWEPIVNGQAEIADMPAEVMDVFSKRTRQVDEHRQLLLEEFREREGRDPTRWEHAVIKRQAAADSRQAKTGRHVDELEQRWQDEAAAVGWTPERLIAALTQPHRRLLTPESVTVTQVLDHLSADQSTWERADVLRAVCDLTGVHAGIDGRSWARSLDRAVDAVVAIQQNLDPVADGPARASDGRSVWMDPAKPHLTDARILEQEERIITFAMEAQPDEPTRSGTVEREGLDVLQADAAAAVAGNDRLVLVVGPAGTGKTTTLARATDDLQRQRRPTFGVAPTAKAARVLAAETGMEADTVAKLLYEYDREHGPGEQWRLPTGTTLIVDETGMVGTPSLDRLVHLARSQEWRLVLVGDPRQLHAVGRGGMFDELCRTGRTHELAVIHRFSHDWERTASRQLRSARSTAIDAYLDHSRVAAGGLEDHLECIADAWIAQTNAARTFAVIAETNAYVDTLNEAIQARRRDRGDVGGRLTAPIANGETVSIGDLVVTRHNDRALRTSTDEPIRNRERWKVTAVGRDGRLAVSRNDGRDTATLPADYARTHVRLGYATTLHGVQGDTTDVSFTLVDHATTQRALYVGATRGRHANDLAVVTETPSLDDARDVLERVLAKDRVDIPAIARRRELADEIPRRQPATVEPPLAAPDPQEAAIEARRDYLRLAKRPPTVIDELGTAEETLHAAQRRVVGLEHRIDESRPWRRRVLRDELADAIARRDTAKAAYVEVSARAQPWFDEVDRLREQAEKLEQVARIERARAELDELSRFPVQREALGR